MADCRTRIQNQTNGLPAQMSQAELPPPSFREVRSLNLRFQFTGTPLVGRSTFIASSRLGKKLEQFPSWFDALRTFFANFDHAHDFMISAEGTSAHPFVKRLCELYRIPLLIFWNHDQKQKPPVFVSGQPDWIQYAEWTTADGAAVSKSISIDGLLVQLAIEVRGLSVKKNGNVERALRDRLAVDPTGTRLLIDRHLTSSRLSDELLADGATAWWLYANDADETTSIPQTKTLQATQQPSSTCYEAPILNLSEVNTDDFLLHWTRSRQGPWPQQSQNAWLDDLIFRHSNGSRQPCSTLCQILATENILGSANLIRASRPVVCFSEVPLNEIESHRVFRRHLGRWDFEPYGIAIQRAALQHDHATLRKVIYGDEQTWQHLNEADRPFFQTANSGEGQKNQIDWRAEREWRVISNVDLKRLDSQSAFVFVPTLADAQTVAKLSRWPIVVL